MQCPNCSNTMVLNAYSHETQVGRRTVVDTSAMAEQCDHCGAVDLSEAQLAIFELRAARIVLLQAKQVGGSELRFARKALGMRQADLAKALGSNVQQLSRYENDDSIGMWLRLAVVALIDCAQRGESMEALGTRTDNLRLSA
jgi:DNA-binding transcriptional regulator YiaG